MFTINRLTYGVNCSKIVLFIHERVYIMENNKPKFSDFWAYNKGKIIGAVLIIAFIVLCITQCNVNPGTDLGILHICEKNGVNGDSLVKSISENVSIEAQNKGDAPRVEFRAVYLPPVGADAMETGSMEKIQMEFASGECNLYILDSETVYSYSGTGLFAPLDEYVQKYSIEEENLLKDKDGNIVGISADSNPLLRECGVESEGLFFALRVPLKKYKTGNQNAQKAFDYIMNKTY